MRVSGRELRLTKGRAWLVTPLAKAFLDSSYFPRGFGTYAKLHTTRVKAGVQTGSMTIWEPKTDPYGSVLTIIQRFLWVYWLFVITGNTRCEGMPGVQNMRWVAGT